HIQFLMSIQNVVHHFILLLFSTEKIKITFLVIAVDVELLNIIPDYFFGFFCVISNRLGFIFSEFADDIVIRFIKKIVEVSSCSSRSSKTGFLLLENQAFLSSFL